MKKNKVLIYGLYDWCNLGDDLMMYEVNKKVNEENITPFFIRNNDDNYFEFEKKYDKKLFLNKKNKNSYFNKFVRYIQLLRLITNKNDYNALIFMGGGYINRSIGSGYGRLMYILLLKIMFKIKRKRIYFTGQTVGPINNQLEKYIIKKIYYKTNIAVREKTSEKILNELGIDNKLVGDDAFLSYNNLDNSLNKEDYIIVNYKDFAGYENIKEDFLQFLENVYNKTLLKIVLVPFRKGKGYSEYEIHQNFFSNLKQKGVKVKLFETKSVEELNKLFASSKFIIATAYHAVVLGLKNNKKVYTGFIGTYYKTKILGITSFYNKDSYKVYDLSIKKIFNNILDDIDINKPNNQDISLKIHNDVNKHWSSILKEINNENRK